MTDQSNAELAKLTGDMQRAFWEAWSNNVPEGTPVTGIGDGLAALFGVLRDREALERGLVPLPEKMPDGLTDILVNAERGLAVSWEYVARQVYEWVRIHFGTPPAPSADERVVEAYGWLIEHPDTSQSVRWVTLRAGTDGPYTTDPEKALRFARREDVDDYASLFGDEDIALKIVEHAWVGPKK